MKKYIFRISVVSLVIILVVVSFYMFYVHVPYYQYHDQLAQVRNDICETNHYEYMDYFHEYRGKEIFYIIKVKSNDLIEYVAYNEKKEFVNESKETIADANTVKQAMEDKYKVKVDQLDVGYENGKFVYYAKVQNEKNLYYIYYDLINGEFVKAYKL